MQFSAYDPPEPPPSDKFSPHARLVPFYMTLAFLGTLAIGAIVGFFARPFVIPDPVVEVIVTPPAMASSSAASQSKPVPEANALQTEATDAEADSSSSSAEQASASEATETPSIMEHLLADARHSQGDPEAPVVIIEFSDFR